MGWWRPWGKSVSGPGVRRWLGLVSGNLSWVRAGRGSIPTIGAGATGVRPPASRGHWLPDSGRRSRAEVSYQVLIQSSNHHLQRERWAQGPSHCDKTKNFFDCDYISWIINFVFIVGSWIKTIIMEKIKLSPNKIIIFMKHKKQSFGKIYSRLGIS